MIFTKYLYLVFVCWVLFCGNVVLADSLEWADKQIKKSFDYVPEEIEYVFSYKNVSEKNINIVNVKADCGCTVPKYSSDILTPNKTGSITIVFSSKGREGDQVKNIVVEYGAEGEESELLQLTVVAELPKWVSYNPKAFAWKMDSKPESKIASVKVQSEDFYISNISVTDSNFHAEIDEKVTPNYEIILRPEKTNLKHRGHVIIRVKNKNKPGWSKKIFIPVSVS